MCHRSRWTPVMLLASIVFLGCQEKTATKPPTAAANNGATPTPTINPYATNDPYISGATSDCTTTSNCPQANDLEIQETSGGSLNATVGTSVNWNFSARSSTYPDREFVVFTAEIFSRPATMTVTGNNSPSLRVNWSPTSRDPASGNIELRARDVTRCKKLKGESNSSMCDDYSTQITKYESTRTLSWSLSGGGQVVNNGGGGLISALLPALIPVGISALSGGGIDIGGLSNALIGSLSGGQTNVTPTTTP